MTSILGASGIVVAEIRPLDTFIEVRPLQLESLEDAARLQLAAEDALRSSGRRRLLFDARSVNVSPAPVNEAMWTWVCTSGHFDLLAIVNQSQVLSIAAKMKALALGTKKVRPFAELGEAVRWLTAGG